MILFDLDRSESEASYKALQVSNLDRQYDFLRSVVDASLATGRTYLSQTVIKAFNYHAIVCLHSFAGEFRQCEVTVGNHTPPYWIHVQAEMDDFVNQINIQMRSADPVLLATYALWRLNYIHPFINGNGRTARLVAYYILCLRFGGVLPGSVSLPELLRRQRGEKDDPYVASLRAVDESYKSGTLQLAPLHNLIQSLIDEQLKSASD